MEQETRELAQKIKALESQKKSSSDEAQRIIAAQRNNIEALRKDNEHIQEQLRKESQGPGLPANQDRVDKLYDLVDTYTRKIEVERRQLESLTQELDLAQVKAAEMRKNVGSASSVMDAQKQAAKHLKVLENRLELAEKKFNETLARNKELRLQVENLNKERTAFDQVYQKLEKELSLRRTENASIKEATSIAVEARSIALQQLETLRAQSDKEKQAFEEETREQARAMEAEQKLLTQQAKRLERLVAAADSCESEGDVEKLEEGGPGCDDVVAQLQEASGIQHLGRLVQHYCCLEASNFEQFAACNAANERLSALQKELRALQDEIRQAEMDGVLSKQKDVIRQALAKRDQATRRVQMFREKTGAMEKRLTLLRAGISQILRQLGCTPISYPRPQSAAPGSAPSAENTNLYAGVLQRNLGLLEARTRAIVAVWSTVMGKGDGGAQQMVLAQRSASTMRASQHLPPALGLEATMSTPPAAGGKGPSTSGDLESPTMGVGTYGPKSPVVTAAKHGGSSAPKGVLQKNALFDNGDGSDGSGSDEDEMPMTREQIQSRLAKNQEAAVAALDCS